jgi:hypothetical protein
MEFFMNKVSIYSLLIALLALNPLQINAMGTSKSLLNKFGASLSQVANNKLALGLGALSFCSFVYGIKNFVDWQSTNISPSAPSAVDWTPKNENKDIIAARNRAGLSFLVGTVSAAYLAYKAMQKG